MKSPVENELTQFRLLLLDDNPADVAAISRILEEIPNKKYLLHRSPTIKDAFNFLEENQDIIDLCLVDYRLYGQTAFHFLEEFTRRNILPLPIVVMTGYADPVVDKQLMEAGIQDYWDKKDLNPETLERCIRYAKHRHDQEKLRDAAYKDDSRHLLQVNNDLKPALKTIVGMSRVLQLLLDKEALQERSRIENCLNEMTQATNKLSVLVDAITELSELEIGNLVLYRSCFSLNHLIKEIYATNLPATTNNDIVLNVNIGSSIELYGDEARIRQVIQNLISNALRYTTQGEITIAAKNHTSLDGSYVEITVVDTGAGISAEQQLTIFSFSREKAIYEASQTHSGFGLPITKRIIELHGGHIEIQSQLTLGTTVTITLPQRTEHN